MMRGRALARLTFSRRCHLKRLIDRPMRPLFPEACRTASEGSQGRPRAKSRCMGCWEGDPGARDVRTKIESMTLQNTTHATPIVFPISIFDFPFSIFQNSVLGFVFAFFPRSKNQ